jgi:hypothetical protein
MPTVRAVFLAGALVSGCATVPSGPSVMVLPGSGKSIETFQVDEIACRQWAGQQIGTRAGGYDGQRGYDMTYMQCMYAKGHRIPVSRGSLPGYTSSPPAEEAGAPTTPRPPAGTPPPPPPR